MKMLAIPRTVQIALAIALAAIGLAIVEEVSAVVHQGLADSQSMRIASATSCPASADAAHFTGCSSIL